MAAPWNAAIAFDNLADRGIVTASSSAILTPPSILQNPHIARKWRGAAGESEYLTADLLDDVGLDTVAVIGLTLDGAGVTRVRVSSSDPSAQAGEVYDSGDFSTVDPRYGMMVHLAPALLVGRYVRVDLNQPGAAAIEAGRLVISPRSTFEINYSPEWTRAYVDRSRKTKSRGGQTYVDRDDSYRIATLTFPAISEAQRFDVVEQIDQANGTHDDVLLITRSDSPNLGRDSIWGLLTELQPVTQSLAWINGAPVYGRAYSIEERL